MNRSRDIVRQANRWFPEEEDGLKDMFVRYMGALPKSMMVHLRTDEDLRLVLNSVPGLLPDEVAAIEASPHRPMHVLQVRVGRALVFGLWGGAIASPLMLQEE